MKLVGNSTYNTKDFCHHFSKPVHLSAQGFCMNQEGGCHVPGLNVSPFPLGSLNLPITSLEESCSFHPNQGALRFFSKIFAQVCILLCHDHAMSLIKDFTRE
jgi:hypothetical protein